MNKPSHDYRIEIPNILDDMDLHPFAFRLYAHLKRRAGDKKECYENTNNLARCCHMSNGAVSHYKKQLVEKGLIQIVKKGKPKFGKRNHHIVIVDLWKKNYLNYSKNKDKNSPNEFYGSLSEHKISADEKISSPNEIKKIPIKKIPEINNPYKNRLLFQKKIISKREEATNHMDRKIKEVI